MAVEWVWDALAVGMFSFAVTVGSVVVANWLERRRIGRIVTMHEAYYDENWEIGFRRRRDV